MQTLIINGTHLKSKEASRLINNTKEALLDNFILEDNLHIIDINSEDNEDLVKEVFMLSQEEKSKAFYSKIESKFDLRKNIIILIPEYNGSFPAFTKALIDSIGGEISLRGCHCTIIGYSGGIKGNQNGINSLIDVLHHCKAIVNPRNIILQNSKLLSDKTIKSEIYNSLELFANLLNS